MPMCEKIKEREHAPYASFRLPHRFICVELYHHRQLR